MLIETLYDIGDKFYIAKSFARTETVIFKDSEGHEWKRQVENYYPVVRHIRIVGLKATMSADGHCEIIYRCRKLQDDDWMGSYYEQHLFEHFYRDFEMAKEAAENYAYVLKREYHGYPQAC